MMMPRLNGVIVAERIKEVLPGTAVVLFTAFESGNLRKYIDGNIDAVVSKTEGLEKLVSELNRVLAD